MQNIYRFLLALSVLLSGVALVPFVHVPAETFEWQRYAGVYDESNLEVNYSKGQPGSYFHFVGTGFQANTGLAPNSTVTVKANGTVLDSMMTDSNGNIEFNLSTANADVGNYYITVENGNISLTVKVILSDNAPLRPLEGTGAVFDLPGGIAIIELYLPVIKN
jgi:hypothetical protein